MTTVGLQEFYAKTAKSSTNFLKTFLMQLPQPVSSKKIWSVYQATPDLRRSGIYKSYTHMKKSAIDPLIAEGSVIRGRAFDIQRYKNSGAIFSSSSKSQQQKIQGLRSNQVS